MIALKVEDVRTFTSKLFVKEDFDRFLVKEIDIVTYNRFTIDGHIRQGYFGEEELEERRIGEFSSWKMLRPLCFDLIKGKKLPGSFHIVLQLGPGDVGDFVKNSGAGMAESQIQGLYLNIRYEEGSLLCVTGTSLNTFTLDKTLETEWDKAVEQFMRDHGIVCVK
ncbi:MAG: DUF5721 family protein [Clostridium sp.]|nr:DUF5721 family protein [Clostridium sp.]